MPRGSPVKRRFRRLLSLSRSEWCWLAQSLVLVPAVAASLRVKGFGPTVRWLGDHSSGPARPEDLEIARSMGRVVNMVAARKIIGTLCLGRSLALWFLMRRRGFDGELVIGAEPVRNGVLPAHAWVELGGIPMNDAADVRDRFGSFGLRLPRLSSPV